MIAGTLHDRRHYVLAVGGSGNDPWQNPPKTSHLTQFNEKTVGNPSNAKILLDFVNGFHNN